MVRLRGSVGRHGINHKGDVEIVQGLLNRHIVPPAKLLKVDDHVGPKTINAIFAFQRRIGLAHPDGRVDPAGPTFRALKTFPKSVPVTHTTHPFSLSDAKKSLWKWVKGGPLGSVLDQFKRKPVDPQSPPKRSPPPIIRPVGSDCIARGAKVSPEFKKRVIEICEELGIRPDYLMACMAFESCETFRADIPNKAGSGAVGLIQFMPKTAQYLGTTTDELAKMKPVEQLEYVRKYFLPYKGKIKTLEDIYMAILWPKAIGKDPDKVIFKAGTKAYEQNKGFDKYNVGVVTPRMCASALHTAYKKGLSKGYFG